MALLTFHAGTALNLYKVADRSGRKKKNITPFSTSVANPACKNPKFHFNSITSVVKIVPIVLLLHRVTGLALVQS